MPLEAVEPAAKPGGSDGRDPVARHLLSQRHEGLPQRGERRQGAAASLLRHERVDEAAAPPQSPDVSDAEVHALHLVNATESLLEKQGYAL